MERKAKQTHWHWQTNASCVSSWDVFFRLQPCIITIFVCNFKFRLFLDDSDSEYFEVVTDACFYYHLRVRVGRSPLGYLWSPLGWSMVHHELPLRTNDVSKSLPAGVLLVSSALSCCNPVTAAQRLNLNIYGVHCIVTATSEAPMRQGRVYACLDSLSVVL
jgi:hypothetical protein